MADFGLVVFDDVSNIKIIENKDLKNLAEKLLQRIIGLLFKAGFFKCSLGTRLFLSSRKKGLDNALTSFDVSDNTRAWIIKLPFSSRILLNLNMKYIIGYLKKICSENGISKCLVPEPIRKNIIDGIFATGSNTGKVLFKSMLVPALEDIYPKQGIRIENLEIVIVSGNDNEELFDIVRMLEPHINFITVVTDEKAGLESKFTELFSDYGLLFSISSEYKSHLKHADLIINLGRPMDIAKYRMSKKSLLINLYEPSEGSLPGENTAINDIAFEIPGANVKNLMYELHGYYSKAELHKIIIDNELNLGDNKEFTSETAKEIQSEFRKAGFRITGFVGRRGIITTDSVMKSLQI